MVATAQGRTAYVLRYNPQGLMDLATVQIPTELPTDPIAPVPIGPLGYYWVSEMTLSPSGTLFGLDLIENQLVNIDVATGAASPLVGIDIAVGGDGHMAEYDKNCAQINGTMERHYPGFTVVPELSFAFYGGEADNADLCLTTLQGKDSVWVDGLAFLITELDGMVLEEITEPISTKTGPLESCWPKGVFFEDFNHDEMNDILLMISCYNKETDQPENDNVVYLSTISEDLIWRRQTAEMNTVVADFSNPNRARKALLSVTSTKQD